MVCFLWKGTNADKEENAFICVLKQLFDNNIPSFCVQVENHTRYQESKIIMITKIGSLSQSKVC